MIQSIFVHEREKALLRFFEDMIDIAGCIGGCFNLIVTLVIAGTVLWICFAAIIGAAAH